jgi:predicted transcriptional regulator
MMKKYDIENIPAMNARPIGAISENGLFQSYFLTRYKNSKVENVMKRPYPLLNLTHQLKTQHLINKENGAVLSKDEAATIIS